MYHREKEALFAVRPVFRCLVGFWRRTALFGDLAQHFLPVLARDGNKFSANLQVATLYNSHFVDRNREGTMHADEFFRR
jgi:hypothetical protein